MNKYLRVFQSIYIHPFLWAVIGIGVITAHFYELCLLLLIILVHELGHALAAAHFSWRIKRIALLPFGGVAEMDEHGNRPLKEEAIVTIAGPLQHLWMVALGYIAYEQGWMSEYLFHSFLEFNLMIFCFNLLPIWPLDGGKVLFLFLSLKKSFPAAHKITLLLSLTGTLLFLGAILLYMPTNLNAWIILLFLWFSLFYEWKQRRYIFLRFLLERYYGKTNELRKLMPIEVKEEELLFHVLERFHRGCKHPIVLKKGKVNHSLDENEVLHAYFAEKLVTAKISDLLYR